MPQSLSNILAHIIFSTKNRQNYLNTEICCKLYPYISSILKNNNCECIRIGGIANHIHILCALAKTISISDLIEKIKSNTSKWIKTKDESFIHFQWQRGYGAFSISPAHLQIVSNYIDHQQMHHQQTTFEDEFRALLKKYNIPHDERYVWD
jgi:REP element-mobilizing transposase RayT